TIFINVPTYFDKYAVGRWCSKKNLEITMCFFNISFHSTIYQRILLMFKVSHVTLIFLSGFVWLAVGCFLLFLGLNFVVAALLKENAAQPHPVLSFFAPYAGGIDGAAMVWIAVALMMGFFKGRRVFAKGVKRSVNRILTLPNPVSLSKIYTPSYYL